MDDGIRPTEDRYDCPNGWKAFAYLYSSLHSDRRACGGIAGGFGIKRKFNETCLSCEYYIKNHQAKDWEDIHKPVGRNAIDVQI